jgi:hypothetical protein
MSRRWALGGGVALVAAILVPGCDTRCAYRIVSRIESGAGRVGCCGASAVEDVTLPAGPGLAVDLAQAAFDSHVGGQDLWMTRDDCAQLFEGPYAAPGTGPRPVPRCDVVAGPVPAGRVSPRAEVAPGRYRVFVQGYSANPGANEYRFTVSVWGEACAGSPVAP